MLYVFVGSTNPVKINAVRDALIERYPGDVDVSGYEVPSNVGEQPMSDEETKQGAINRGTAALAAGLAEKGLASEDEALGVGLEGGVLINDQDEMWSTVWAAVVDQAGEAYLCNGARLKVPEIIAAPIREGKEMGPIMQQLTGISDVRKKQGMFGVVTKNFVTRTEKYADVVRGAFGVWYGRDWADQLETPPEK